VDRCILYPPDKTRLLDGIESRNFTPALNYYWRIASIHVAAISLFFQATIDAFFQPVAYSLGAAAQRV